MKEIKAQHEIARQQMVLLGEDSSTPINRRMIFEKIKRELFQSLDASLQGRVEGWVDDSDGYGLIPKLIRLFDEFGEKIKRSKLATFDKPVLFEPVMLVEGVNGGVPVYGRLIETSSDGNCYVYPDDVMNDADYFISKLRYEPTAEEIVSQSFWKTNSAGKYVEFEPIPLTSLQYDNSTMLRSMLMQTQFHSLPIFSNSAVFDKIISDNVRNDWAPMVDSLHKSVQEVFDEMTQWTVQHCLKEHHGRMRIWVNNLFRDCLSELMDKSLAILKTQVSQETCVYTNNHYLFENIVKQRMEPLLNSLKNCQDNNGNVKFATVEAYVQNNKQLDCNGHVVIELQLAINSYGKLAAKRFADAIPQTIQFQVVQQLHDNMQVAVNCLDDELEQLLKESTSDLWKREELQSLLDRTTNVIKAFGHLFDL
jgi:hypothetical protein